MNIDYISSRKYSRTVCILGAGAYARDLKCMLNNNYNNTKVFLVDPNIKSPKNNELDIDKIMSLKNGSIISSEFYRFLSGMPYVYTIMGSGKIEIRKKMLKEGKTEWFTYIDKTASLWDVAEVGNGVAVSVNTVISNNSVIGNHVACLWNVMIGHDVIIGDLSVVAPCASVGSYSVLGERCYIGLGATVRDGVKIGNGAFVGAGAVVVKDVLPNTTVVGVPAKPIIRH